MKTKSIFYIVFALLLSFSFTTISAQSKTSVVKKKQVNQQKRIKQGIKSGELTRVETKQLKKQQLKIQKIKKTAKADGKVTKREKLKLNTLQEKASKNIYAKKHNNRNRK